MKTGMVIVHYNDYESLDKLLNNIKDYKCLDKIIVVDNRSRKEEINKLKSISLKNVEVIYNKENRGFSYAINIGCKKLIELYKECNAIISNCDIKIDKEDSLIKLVKYLDKESVGVVAPTIIENNNVNRGWRLTKPILDALMNLPYIHRILRKKYGLYDNKHYHGDISYVDVVSGCFFLIRTDTLKEINFLDENVFLYYEENILAKKIKNINKKEIVCNNIDIIHEHSVSIDKNVKKLNKIKLQKQSQYYYEKNYNNANIFELCLLKINAFISRIILGIFYTFKDIFRRK